VSKTWAAFVLIWCLVGSSVLAQTEDAAPEAGDAIGGLPYTGEVEVTVVNINVYVTDKKGLAVTDMAAEDFVLTQDGVAKPISNFSLFTEEIYRSFHAPEGPPMGLLEPTPIPGTENLTRESFRPVYVVLYFDNDNSRPLDRNRLITQMRTFVRENLQPPVQMMVMTYDKSAEVVQGFTSDQRAINDALREVKVMTGGRTEVDNMRKDILREMDDSRSSASGRNDPQAMGRAHGLMIGFAEEEANRLQFTLGALRDTVTMLSGLPGKKVIVYASNGLPMVAGLDLFHSYANTFSESSAMTESARYNMHRHFNSLISNANAQDISFYTFAVGGLENPTLAGSELGNKQDMMSASIGMKNYLDSLLYMADGTGGVAVVNTNDFTVGLEKVAQDFFTYYSVGYSLQQSGLDKVHRIKVELPDHPDYRLRYRRRFVEKSLESRVQDKVVTGLMFPLDDNPMEIMVSTDEPGPASETRWMVPIRLSFPLRKVALLPVGDDYVGNVTMFVAARNTKGDRSDVVRQNHEIRIKAAEYETAQDDRFAITANLLMEAGKHNVAVAILDPITRNSSYTTTKVTVQD
jgi:VWFA-related protein